MKKLFGLLITVLIITQLVSCAPNVTADETEPTPLPTALPTPTPEPQAGESFDRHRERITCRVNEDRKDTKDIWKVKSPTESPDPAWVVEEVDGDVITYSKTYCDHMKCTTKEVQCPYNPDETDLQYYYTMLEETANKKEKPANWKLVSAEDGFVTYEVSLKCNDIIHQFVRCDDMDELVPCQLCPESGLFDCKSYLKVPAWLSTKPGKGYTYEYTEGDWEYYSKISCNEQHEAYAAAYAALAEKADE